MSKYSEDNFWQTIWEFLPGITKFLSVLGVIFVLFNVFTLAFEDSNKATREVSTSDVFLQKSYNNTVGNKNAKVKLVYFVDYQCPACKGNHPVMNDIRNSYQDRVEFIYKHFPLESIHPYAIPAAKGVQAAGKQGKYKEFEEKVFALQDTGLTASVLEEVAKDLGLDITRWNNDRNSREIANQISFDKEDLTDAAFPKSTKNNKEKAAGNLKDIGTPISVLYKNGQVIDWWTGGLPAQELKNTLDNALKS